MHDALSSGCRATAYCTEKERRTNGLAQQAAAASNIEAQASAEAAQLICDAVFVNQGLAISGEMPRCKARQQHWDDEARAAV